MQNQQYHSQHPAEALPYHEAKNLNDKVIFILNSMGAASADEVVQRMEQLEPQAEQKLLIAETHLALTELFKKGLVSGEDKDGTLIYKLS